jgi:hypothetical protein
VKSLTSYVARRGRGQNDSPNPRRTRKLGGGSFVVHRLWHAVLVGRWK